MPLQARITKVDERTGNDALIEKGRKITSPRWRLFIQVAAGL
jgi:hypothetical protein